MLVPYAMMPVRLTGCFGDTTGNRSNSTWNAVIGCARCGSSGMRASRSLAACGKWWAAWFRVIRQLQLFPSLQRPMGQFESASQDVNTVNKRPSYIVFVCKMRHFFLFKKISSSWGLLPLVSWLQGCHNSFTIRCAEAPRFVTSEMYKSVLDRWAR